MFLPAFDFIANWYWAKLCHKAIKYIGISEKWDPGPVGN